MSKRYPKKSATTSFVPPGTVARCRVIPDREGLRDPLHDTVLVDEKEPDRKDGERTPAPLRSSPLTCVKPSA